MSLNKVILIGRLGRAPEVRHMPNGEAVCNFSIATSETWKDQHGQKQERTEWHAITLYRRLAEVAGQYLKKGSLVYIEGRIQSRKYTDKNGVERTAYEIIGNEMKMLGGGNDSGQQAQAAQAETPTPPRRQASAAPAQPVDDIDDDIPF
jgi:single-stranded DNA-binding protein